MRSSILKTFSGSGAIMFSKYNSLSSMIISPISQATELQSSHTLDPEVAARHVRTSRKRSLSDILTLVPSLQRIKADPELRKRRKISESALHHSAVMQTPSSLLTGKAVGYMYGGPLAEANHGHFPSNIYVSIFLLVVKHCSLCIKHAQLTSQLEYSFIDSQWAFMKYLFPLREIVVDFYNELKGITFGYASFDYEDTGYQKSDLVNFNHGLTDHSRRLRRSTITHTKSTSQVTIMYVSGTFNVADLSPYPGDMIEDRSASSKEIDSRTNLFLEGENENDAKLAITQLRLF